MLRIIAALLLLTTPAAAVESDTSPHRLRWDPSWRRSNWIDYTASAAITGYALYLQFGVRKPTHGNWTRPILFDEEVEEATVAGSYGTRNKAAAVGDGLFYGLQLLPFVDSAVTPLLFDHGNDEVAWELEMMNIQATSTMFALARTGHRFVARERPDVTKCNGNPSFSETCFGGSYSSFPSGHTAAAFAGAGLMCTHHTRLPLWGDPIADASACVVPLALAATTGATRLMAARHWATDVLAGAVLGFGTGYGMPTLLHYAPLAGRSRDLALTWAVHPYAAGDTGQGIAISGLF